MLQIHLPTESSALPPHTHTHAHTHLCVRVQRCSRGGPHALCMVEQHVEQEERAERGVSARDGRPRRAPDLRTHGRCAQEGGSEGARVHRSSGSDNRHPHTPAGMCQDMGRNGRTTGIMPQVSSTLGRSTLYVTSGGLANPACMGEAIAGEPPHFGRRGVAAWEPHGRGPGTVCTV